MGGAILIISKETLDSLATTKGFQPDTLEKVSYLLSILSAIAEDEFFSSRLVLKGGTALNLFFFDMPRLSIDIDFNYVGSPDKETMLADREKLEKLIPGMLSSLGLPIEKKTDDYACTQYIASYKSFFVGRGKIKIDINYLHRILYWDCLRMDSCVLGTQQAKAIPLISLYELSAGKIVALLARTASRDLFDTKQLSTKLSAEDPNLRLAYILYAAKQPKDWQKVTIDDIKITAEDVKQMLYPMVNKELTKMWASPKKCTEDLINSCRKFLKSLFPLKGDELEFINLLRNKGVIEASLLTTNQEIISKAKQDPALLLRASKAGK